MLDTPDQKGFSDEACIGEGLCKNLLLNVNGIVDRKIIAVFNFDWNDWKLEMTYDGLHYYEKSPPFTIVAKFFETEMPTVSHSVGLRKYLRYCPVRREFQREFQSLVDQIKIWK